MTTIFEKDDILVSDTGGSEEKIQAVLSLEIGQSGSYVPHGISNWQVLQNGVNQTMILKL